VLVTVNHEPLAADFVAALKATTSAANRVVVVQGNDVSELMKIILSYPRSSEMQQQQQQQQQHRLALPAPSVATFSTACSSY
jgi:translation initiation factor 1 (eIF-1/SUI1)